MNARVGMVVGLLLGAVVVTLNPVGPARACSCMVTTVESSVADADAAFVGVATEELNVPLGPGVTDEFGGGPGSWAFDVVEVVKGELDDRVEVWQDMNGECGPIFEIGELIGVVVRRVGDRYVTSDCGGVWLPDELLAPGTLASPTGSGPVALVAAGRTGDAVLATYDADGNLLGWGLGEPGDILMRPRVCPGSSLLVGMRIGLDGTTSVVRWDLATLQQVSAATLPPPETVGHDWADNLGMSCTSADGDVAFLLSATPCAGGECRCPGPRDGHVASSDRRGVGLRGRAGPGYRIPDHRGARNHVGGDRAGRRHAPTVCADARRTGWTRSGRRRRHRPGRRVRLVRRDQRAGGPARHRSPRHLRLRRQPRHGCVARGCRSGLARLGALARR